VKILPELDDEESSIFSLGQEIANKVTLSVNLKFHRHMIDNYLENGILMTLQML
jgi:hypothetical protein